ncbi:MAG: zinc ABC transporter substrate-binding protein [Gammaproteobacteria bacterium]|nr:zinc ABC transporter substrate-binding protein [Gammaproteobacteria bacterium]
MILRCCLLLLVLFTPVLALSAEQSATGSDVKHKSASKLKVVTTIRPLHSLLSSIMQGNGKPVLLLDSRQSIHHYSLRPSQRRALADADLIFWLAESLESFMPRVLKAIPEQIHVVKLIDTKGLLLLEPRTISADADKKHRHGDEHRSHIDPHIWLSIDNALLIAAKMSETLSMLDPAFKHLYQNNLIRLSARLNALQKKISLSFDKRRFDYLVYHDAFQYFENAVNIKPLAAISKSEEQRPGIRHLSQIQKLLSDKQVSCLVYNTKPLPAIAANLIRDTAISPVYLDPTAQDFAAGTELYFQLMQAMHNAYAQCQKTDLTKH